MSVHGDYKITITTPAGAIETELSVDVDGSHLSGEMHDSNGHTSHIEGEMHGHDVTWHTHVTDPEPMDLEFHGTCSDDVCTIITGEVATADGRHAPFTGHREH